MNKMKWTPTSSSLSLWHTTGTYKPRTEHSPRTEYTHTHTKQEKKQNKWHLKSREKWAASQCYHPYIAYRKYSIASRWKQWFRWNCEYIYRRITEALAIAVAILETENRLKTVCSWMWFCCWGRGDRALNLSTEENLKLRLNLFLYPSRTWAKSSLSLKRAALELFFISLLFWT